MVMMLYLPYYRISRSYCYRSASSHTDYHTSFVPGDTDSGIVHSDNPVLGDTSILSDKT